MAGVRFPVREIIQDKFFFALFFFFFTLSTYLIYTSILASDSGVGTDDRVDEAPTNDNG